MLCQFAKTFPHFVARFLAQGQTLKRRFREETVTDLLMGGLITAAGGKLIVEFPNEPVTGADTVRCLDVGNVYFTVKSPMVEFLD